MRILVTGGAGFLGSHLIDALLAAGDSVVCLDDFSTGRRVNIEHHLGNPRLDVLDHDVTIPLEVEVDQIYNLACPASPVSYQLDPVRTTQTIVLGAVNMLNLARRLNIPILQASTSEIYGDPLVHPQVEEYWGNVNPVGIRSCYDEGKRCAETLFFDYHRQYGVAIKVMRIFNTYGPRMAPDDGRVISNFICQALRGDPLSIFGDGSQTRSFCYVSDLIAAMRRFMASPPDVTGPLNVGNPQETTIAELSQKILALSGSASVVDQLPLPADDPRRRQPNIDRARKALGWQPTVTIEDGLTQTVAYFRSGGF